MKKLIKIAKIKLKKPINKQALIILSLVIFFFLSFGLYHLTKFETIDEPLWKHDRIEKYYNGLKEGVKNGKWKKTRINDKPGVTVALISGLGIHVVPPLNEHRDLKAEEKYLITDKQGDIKPAYSIFKTELTEKINLALRLPILLFNAFIILPLIFWLLTKIFNFKSRIPQTAIIFIGLSPILIGISQIINPDSFLWGFFVTAILSFMVLLKTDEKKFILLTGILTGMALLSKYTATLLYLIFPVVFGLWFLFSKRLMAEQRRRHRAMSPSLRSLFGWKLDEWPVYFRYVISFSGITLISWVVFAVLMPAVLQKPEHFLYGTIYSPALEPLVNIFIKLFHLKGFLFTAKGDFNVLPLGLFSLMIFCFLFIAIPALMAYFFKKKNKKLLAKLTAFVIRGLAFLLLFLFLLSLVNAWTNASLFPLDDTKEISLNDGKLSFDQFAGTNLLFRTVLGLATQTQNFFFAMHPIVLVLSTILWGAVAFNKIKKYRAILYFLVFIPYVFILGGILGGIFLNVRYGIVLYPLYGIFAAVGLRAITSTSLSDLFRLNKKNTTMAERNRSHLKLPFVGVGGFLILFHLISLFLIKPFYFNYENFLMPKKFTVTDAWGFGIYEAAMYLNSLENPEEIVVWSDRGDSLCQFFVGKCVKSGNIDNNQIKVDYIVLSRRGELLWSFKWNYPELAQKPVDFYYSDQRDLVFEIPVAEREKDYIRVVKLEE